MVKKFIEKNKITPQINLATDPNYVDLCEFFQREMEKIGIKIKIEVMPTATLRQAKSNGKVEAFRGSWIADYPDAENYLSLFSSSNLSPYGPNYTHFKNYKFDSLYNKSFEITELEIRNELYSNMNDIIMENLPIIPLYYDQTTIFVRNNIKDFPINPINLIKLKKVYKDKTE
jgi:ABC-type transport system substrate-binding protein